MMKQVHLDYIETGPFFSAPLLMEQNWYYRYWTINLFQTFSKKKKRIVECIQAWLCFIYPWFILVADIRILLVVKVIAIAWILMLYLSSLLYLAKMSIKWKTEHSFFVNISIYVEYSDVLAACLASIFLTK